MTMTLAIKRAKGAPTIRRRGSVVLKEVVNASINQNTPNFQFLFLNLECKRIEDWWRRVNQQVNRAIFGEGSAAPT
jgi:hypothetical protein